MTDVFFKGLLIGFAIAAPVGPIGILCIQRSLHQGFKVGLATGLGAAIADGIYGLIAGCALTAVSTFLIHYRQIIQLIGGIFLLYLGAKILSAKIKRQNADNLGQIKEISSTHAILTTFVLTLSNPTTILSFIAVFAGLGIGTMHTNYFSSFLLVFGVIAGSALWWLTLSSLVGIILRHKLSQRIMLSIQFISGLIILLFGLVSVGSIFV